MHLIGLYNGENCANFIFLLSKDTKLFFLTNGGFGLEFINMKICDVQLNSPGLETNACTKHPEWVHFGTHLILMSVRVSSISSSEKK